MHELVLSLSAIIFVNELFFDDLRQAFMMVNGSCQHVVLHALYVCVNCNFVFTL